jgi:aldose 1-epimerase
MPEIELVFGSSSKAIISTTGGALLELEVESKKLMSRASDPQKIFAGSVLAPWQNRLAKGEYVDSNGNLRTVPINEKNFNNSLHGMVLTAEFRVVEKTSNKVVLATSIAATEGYPHNLELEITYQLNDLGFLCEFSATNNSELTAPFVIGFHPYFTIGDPKDATLTLPAQSYYPQDANKVPLTKTGVAGTSFDFRTARTLDGVVLDDYFTDLEITNGEIVSVLKTANWSIELTQSINLPHLVIYLKDNYESEGKLLSAVAIEPASGPANAFNSKEDLTFIKTAESFTGNWSVRLTAQ